MASRGVAITLLASALTVMSALRATAEGTACYTVQQGDTAALISRQLTGSIEHTDAAWFQIIDTSISKVVPKSDYGRIQPGWRACIPSSRLRLDFSPSTTTPRVALGRQPKMLPENMLAIAWWGFAVIAVTLIADAAWTFVTWRRSVVKMMQQFGERFVCEFERPLIEPGCLERPVESRLHVIPGRKRLEIFLAPTGRRRYPNLSDHRRNVTYDADRVARLLNEERFVGGQLGADGRWVVITCHFRVQTEQKGNK